MKISKAPSPPRTDDDMVEPGHRRPPAWRPSTHRDSRSRSSSSRSSNSNPAFAVRRDPPEYTVQNNHSISHGTHFYGFQGLASLRSSPRLGPTTTTTTVPAPAPAPAPAEAVTRNTWSTRGEGHPSISPASSSTTSSSAATRVTTGRSTYREDRLQQEQRDYCGDDDLPSLASYTSGSVMTLSTYCSNTLPSLMPCESPSASFRTLESNATTTSHGEEPATYDDVEQPSSPSSAPPRLSSSHGDEDTEESHLAVTVTATGPSGYGDLEQDEASLSPEKDASDSHSQQRRRRRVLLCLVVCCLSPLLITCAILAALVWNKLSRNHSSAEIPL